jgi:carbon monoxide dehydrogenase subunit G
MKRSTIALLSSLAWFQEPDVPGCEKLEKTDERSLLGLAKMEVSSVSAAFRAKITPSDLDFPKGYRIAGEGEGGMAGFANGDAKVNLVDGREGGTLLSYLFDAQIGGKLAQLGQRLINGTARKMADDFFTSFARAL